VWCVVGVDVGGLFDSRSAGAGGCAGSSGAGGAGEGTTSLSKEASCCTRCIAPITTADDGTAMMSIIVCSIMKCCLEVVMMINVVVVVR